MTDPEPDYPFMDPELTVKNKKSLIQIIINISLKSYLKKDLVMNRKYDLYLSKSSIYLIFNYITSTLKLILQVNDFYAMSQVRVSINQCPVYIIYLTDIFYSNILGVGICCTFRSPPPPNIVQFFPQLLGWAEVYSPKRPV